MSDDEADREVGQPSDEGGAVQPRDFGPRPILITVAVYSLFGAFGHATLWLAAAQKWIDGGVYWQPVFGISIVVVSVTAFGGFYIASQRTRVAIASSFLLTFLVALTYVLTIDGLATIPEKGAARDLFDDFRTVVITIIGFYFGTEAIVSVAKVAACRRPKWLRSPCLHVSRSSTLDT